MLHTKPNKATSNPVAQERGARSAAWERFSASDVKAVERLTELTGIDLTKAAAETVFHEGKFTVFSLDFLALQKGEKTANRVMFFLSADKLYSLEPEPAPAALDTAQSRMQRDGRTNDAADSFSVVLQTLADAADDLLDAMSDDVSDGLVQSNAVLENLDVKGRDFGVTDVVSTQIVLGDIEELLSRCAESLIGMGLAARQAASRIKTDDVFLAGRYKTLVSDIEAVADDADFLHERVRFLQTINGLALNVKQNQIIKVFTVITAVFLPALLVSTYYSMNLEFLPVLEWKYVEPATLIFTAVLAIVPLIYVKQRGWLR